MPTTTKGTWTPADNDDWDLTIDLAATANSIDLWTTGRYEKSASSIVGLGTGDYVGQLGFVTSPSPGNVAIWNGSAWAYIYTNPGDPVKYVKVFDTPSAVAASASVTTLTIPAQAKATTFLITTNVNFGNGGAGSPPVSASISASSGTLTGLKSGVVTLQSGHWSDFVMLHKLSVPIGASSTLTLANGATGAMFLRGAIIAEPSTIL